MATKRKIPRVVDANGDPVICGCKCMNGATCGRKATYPDAKCWAHTEYLVGGYRDRMRQDSNKGGGHARKRAIWDRFERAMGLID